MDTLLRLEPVAPLLADRLGIDLLTAERAFRAEVAYYLEHQLEGSDTAGLADLRRRCAAIVGEVAGVPTDLALVALMESLRFTAFDDARPALAELHARGVRIVVVSNWDCSLGEVLERLGLLGAIDAVVTSAQVGAWKPDPRVFEAALDAAGCAATEAVHVGDSEQHDVAGARAAGIRALLLDRSGHGGDLTSLAALPVLLGAAAHT